MTHVPVPVHGPGVGDHCLKAVTWITCLWFCFTIRFYLVPYLTFDFIFSGVFAPLSKISKALERNKASTKTSTPLRPPRRVDSTRLKPKLYTGKLNHQIEHCCLIKECAGSRRGARKPSEHCQGTLEQDAGAPSA